MSALQTNSARAQTNAIAQSTDLYTYCQASTKAPRSSGYYFILYISPLLKVDSKDQVKDVERQWKDYIVTVDSSAAGSCMSEPKPEKDAAFNRTNYNKGMEDGRFLDWRPVPSIPAGGVKTIPVVFYSGGTAGRGYNSASMQFRYRFLLCADEIQVAYALDRTSLTYTAGAYVAGRVDGNLVMAADPQAAAPPAVPMTIAISLAIIKTSYPETVVGQLVDKIAGEALGMGCFSGQTRRVGMLAKLVGASPTRTQVQQYLDSLILQAGYGQGINLPYPLLNAAIPAPPGAAALGKESAAPRAAAPPPPDDAAIVAAGNASMAKIAEEQTRKIIADKEAYRVAMEKWKADSAAQAALYRQQAAEREARNAAIVRRNAARMALYQACVAGDKAACQRYGAQ